MTCDVGRQRIGLAPSQITALTEAGWAPEHLADLEAALPTMRGVGGRMVTTVATHLTRRGLTPQRATGVLCLIYRCDDTRELGLGLTPAWSKAVVALGGTAMPSVRDVIDRVATLSGGDVELGVTAIAAGLTGAEIETAAAAGTLRLDGLQAMVALNAGANRP